jgi:hypothetical protein
LIVQGFNYTADFSVANASAQIIGTRMNNDAWNPTLNIVTSRQSLTTGSLSFGGIGFSTIDASNSSGQYDAARIAVVNRQTSTVLSSTALAFYTQVGGVSSGNAATEGMRLDTTNGLQVGTTAGNSGTNGLHVTGNIYQGASGLSQQQIVIGGGNSIQSQVLGVGYYPLLLNPLGALVTINNTTGAQLINESSLNANSTGNTITIKATSAGDGSGINPILCWNSGTSGNNGLIAFFTETSYTARGAIYYNRAGGVLVYATTSDYRAKDIFGPVTNSGEMIDSVPVYMGKMKGATLERPMFIAHETPEYAHSGEKDAVDEDGNPVYQTMDNSILVPVMWAEIQSLRKRLAAAGVA